MRFYVGQKVVHVASPPETWSDWWYRILHPSKYDTPEIGNIYTVSNVYVSWDGNLILEIAEIYAPPEKYWEAGFSASTFRPLVETQTDISVFTKLLDESKIKENA